MRIIFVAIILLLYALLCYACWRKYCGSQSSKIRGRPVVGANSKPPAWLIAYASQGGTAAQLAWQSADQMAQAGLNAEVLSVNRVNVAALAQYKNVLFIASTFGEGEAPDNGNRILSRLRGADLRDLRYGLLALGDRHYQKFCGFGHALDHALHAAGARSLFDLIEVDRGDPAALRHWQYYLGQITGQAHFHDWQSPRYETWQLRQRTCLNQGSPGAPVYWIQLAGPEGMDWCAGDIAEIGPCNSLAKIEQFLQVLGKDPQVDALFLDTSFLKALRRRELPGGSSSIDAYRGLDNTTLLQKLPLLPHREYSIASLPESGGLELLVRQVKSPDGELGLGSGWLTHHAGDDDAIYLRIRRNPGFHPPPNEVPLILIGNGTGMAGLRAHLLHRVARGAKSNWLLFGERTSAHDFFFADEIRSWQAQGYLEHVDLAFSRESHSGGPCYVQHLLAARSEQLRSWVASGAAIFVCGSLQGMAPGVDAELEAILGRALLDVLVDEGRYRRDVY